MASISSPGLGSGLNVTELVKDILEAERKPTTLRLDTREAEYQAKLTSFGVLQGALSDFQTKLTSLRSVSALASFTATSSDESAISVAAGTLAAEGDYRIEVTSLAEAHSLASAATYDSLDTIVGTGDGTGTLTFSFGSWAQDTKATEDPADDEYTFTKNTDKASHVVEITDGSLAGIRDAVNAADIGVKATIVDVGGNQFQLLFTSEDAGKNNALQIEASANLTALQYDKTSLEDELATKMTQTQAAQDATLSYNGLTVTRQSNKITDLISGATLTLNAPSTNGAATISIAREEGNLAAKATEFVTGFNELMTVVGQLTSFNKDTKQAGVLLGDANVRSITSQLRRIMAETIPNVGSKYNSLASIGIRTQANGTLSLDEEKLNAAIAADPDAVTRIFAVAGSASGDDGLKYLGSTSLTQGGLHQVRITQPATRATYTGTALDPGDFPFTVDATNDTFKITVDGSTAVITLTHAVDYTSDTLAEEIQSQINGNTTLRAANAAVTVEFTNNQFVVTSNKYGSTSEAEVTEGSATLGFAAGTAVAGLDVAGTIGGSPATGSGQILVANAGDAVGMSIQYTGTSTGVVGGITFARGYADQLFRSIADLLAADGGLTTKTDGLQKSIDDITSQREALDERLAALETRLLTQFTNMDIVVAQLKQTSDFLTQQLATLPTVGGSSKR